MESICDNQKQTFTYPTLFCTDEKHNQTTKQPHALTSFTNIAVAMTT